MMKKALLTVVLACLVSTISVAATPDNTMMISPTVLKLRGMDTFSPKVNDPYLMGLATNYKSYAEYQAFMANNTRAAEFFAQKAIAVYSGERVEPENPAKWKIDKSQYFALEQGYNQIQFLLRRNAADCYPIESAEAQSKFDCWLDQTAINGPVAQKEECRRRFYAAINTLNDYYDFNGRQRTCAKKELNTKGAHIMPLKDKSAPSVSTPNIQPWPDTGHLVYMNNLGWRSERPITVLHKIEMPCCGQMAVNPNGQAISRAEFDALKADVEQLKKDVAGLKAVFMKLNAGEEGDDSIELIIQSSTGRQIDTFELFFDFDKTQIKDKYTDVLAQVVELSKSGDISFVIEGHTDTMGSKDYNDNLGLRRAKSVQKYLIEAGVDAKALAIVSKGETDLKVPTADQVKNVENRRAVITVSSPKEESVDEEVEQVDDQVSEEKGQDVSDNNSEKESSVEIVSETTVSLEQEVEERQVDAVTPVNEITDADLAQ